MAIVFLQSDEHSQRRFREFARFASFTFVVFSFTAGFENLASLFACEPALQWTSFG